MIQNWQSWSWKLGLAHMLAVGALSSMTCASAQNVVLDGTLGSEGPVPVTSGVPPFTNRYVIRQQDGHTVGSNLFHSFKSFNLDSNEAATFQSSSSIQNILSRVTGGFPSSINGLIETQSRTVNLFLINPNGVIFGPNARLSIGSATRGSFVATTVDALVWPNGSQFSATNPQAPNSLLTIVGDPSGFLASQRPPQPITITASRLGVSSGQSLLLVGGDIQSNRAALSVPGGRIELGGLAGDGTVGLDQEATNLRLRFPTGIARADVSLINGTNIVVSSPSSGSGGSIAINAGSLFLDNSFITSTAVVRGNAGDIAVQADDAIALSNRSSISSNTLGAGNSGSIDITTQSLFLNGESSLVARTAGAGNAGKISIREANTVAIAGGSAISSSSSGGARGAVLGDAGEINIETGVLSLDRAQLSTATERQGKGGAINITARLFSMTDSLVLTRTTGDGDAGNITVKVNESVRVNAVNSPTVLTTSTSGSGNAGALTLTTGHLQVEGGARISASTSGSGQGGSLHAIADSLDLVGTSADGRSPSGLFTEAFSTGPAGNLAITATTGIGQVNIRDGAQVSVSSNNPETGQAGNVDITARSVRLDTQGKITAETASGNGGNIVLQVQDLLLLRRSSTVSATAGSAQAGGDGGNIRIFAPNGFIVAAPNENSDITANAFTGSGGQVTISAQKIFWLVPRSRADLERLLGGPPLDPRRLSTNDITAISQENPNLSGEVTINTPDVDPNRGLVALPVNLVDPSALIAQECSPTSQQAGSSFVVTGRGGLPPNPIGVLGGETVTTRLATLEDRQPTPSTRAQPTATATQPASEIVEAQGWVIGPDGVVTLVAAASNAVPVFSWTVPPACQR